MILTLCTHCDRHFVQYHNPDKMGHRHELGSDFSILTNKPHSLLAALLGNIVWLIGGDHRPRQYSLCYVFVVDEIGESDEPNFRWYARGTNGHGFQPPLAIERDPWFQSFLRRQANFSLGLRELGQEDIAQLQRFSGVSGDQCGEVAVLGAPNSTST